MPRMLEWERNVDPAKQLKEFLPDVEFKEISGEAGGTKILRFFVPMKGAHQVPVNVMNSTFFVRALQKDIDKGWEVWVGPFHLPLVEGGMKDLLCLPAEKVEFPD